MSLAPWRSPLARAIYQNKSLPYSRYFQLATVTQTGIPCNRTVVFRGFLEDTNQLQVITDRRSAKINQLQNQPWTEICWYFTKTREQFRLTGKISIVSAKETNIKLVKARQRCWQKLSDAARKQFAWTNPGEPLLEKYPNLADKSTSQNEPITNFYLLLINPQKVDHLQLKAENHLRRIYTLNENQTWTMQPVNP